MPRYIDADKFISEIDKAPAYFRHNGDVMYGLEIAKAIIENALPTDVAKVKHGEWGDTGIEELDLTYSGYKCSECGDIICGNMTNYCSECGAKMDGGK